MEHTTPGMLGDFYNSARAANVTTDSDNVSTNISDVFLNVSSASSSLNEAAMFLVVYFPPVIFIFGIIGNSVSFVIFLSQKMRRVSTNIYLAALSASNCIFLVAVGVAWTDMVGLKLMHRQGICQATVYLTYCSDFLSVWLVVCITVENFVINFFLHKASYHCTIRRALSFVVLLCVSAFLLYDFAIWTTGMVLNSNNQSSQTQQYYCSVYHEYRPIVEIFTLVDVGVTLLLPSIVIPVLVIPTCFKNVSCRNRGPAAGSTMLSRKERALLRVTRLLCVIIVSYVLLTAPSHVNKLRFLFGPKRSKQTKTSDALVVLIVQTLNHLSFSMNFVYFLIWGKNFRDSFCYMFVSLHRVFSRCWQKLIPYDIHR